MIVLAIVAALVTSAMIATHIVVVRRFHDEAVAALKAAHVAADERGVALYKQTKAANRAATAEATAAAETVRHLHEDARLALQRADALARDVKAGR